jgi:hypothetical protein
MPPKPAPAAVKRPNAEETAVASVETVPPLPDAVTFDSAVAPMVESW